MKYISALIVLLFSFSAMTEEMSPATELLKKVVNDFTADTQCAENPAANDDLARQKILAVLKDKGYDVKATIDEERAFKNIERTCKVCHSGANPLMGLGVPDKAGMATFAEHQLANPDRTTMMRLHDETMPMEMELKAEERKEMIIYLMKFLDKKKGT